MDAEEEGSLTSGCHLFVVTKTVKTSGQTIRSDI